METRFHPARVLTAALLLLFLAGCSTGCSSIPIPIPQAAGSGPTLTPTMNPALQATMQAISAMLTETAAAPTLTTTPTITVTPTPTVTVAVPVTGSQGLPGKIGQWIEMNGVRLAVVSASIQTSVGRLKAQAGNTYVDVEVMVVNASNASQPYTPLYFKLVNNNASFQPATDALWPALLSGDLQPGEMVRGHVAFEVPAANGTGGDILSYTPQIEPGPFPSLWVDLSQSENQSLAEPKPIVSPTPLPGRGQRVEAGGIALTIGQVSASAQVANNKAAKGRKYVSLEVIIENVSHAEAPYNPGYFSAKDAAGYEYPAVVLPVEGLLQAGSQGQGQKVSGQVVFEVPQDADRLVVKYLPLVLNGNYQEIRVEVNIPAGK